jgi:VWFA-related protein
MHRGMALSSPRSFLALAFALLVPLAAFAAAPAKPAAPPASAPPAPETFFESVDVQVVNVEVYVTDRDGKRVSGLKREDFELTEDGKPVPISNFYAVDGTAAAPAQPAEPQPAGAEATPPAEQRLYLTVFLDQRSLTGPGRNRVLPALKSFVAGRLRPGDRLLLASYNGSVRVDGPTADPAAIGAALASLTKEVPRGTEAMIDYRRVFSDISQAQNHDEPNRPAIALEQARETYASVRLLAQSGYDQVRATLGAVGQFVDSLAGLPGRKAVLLVSGGLAQFPADSLFQFWRNKFAQFIPQVGASNFDSFRENTTQLFERLAEHANASRVTFYTLAVPEDLSGSSAEFAGDSSWTPEVARSEDWNQTQPLAILSQGTGGLSAVGAPGRFFDRLRDDLGSYYSLGYVPPHRKDGKKHRLAIKVRDRSLAVRTREAYRAPTGAEATASRTLSALLLGEEVNPFDVALAVEGERKDKKGQYEVSLLVKLPMSKVVLVPRGDAHEGRMRIYVGAKDTQGRVSDLSEIAVPIKVPNDQLLTALGQSFGTRVTLLLRPGEHRLAVGVRDELGNADSTVTGTYTAGSLSATAAPSAAGSATAAPAAAGSATAAPSAAGPAAQPAAPTLTANPAPRPPGGP